MSDEHIRVTNAGLDDDDTKTEILLRGKLAPESLQFLRVDRYQREILPFSNLLKLTEAFQHGSVPDIDLGMRGGNFQERDGVFTLLDPVYIIDGLQRQTAALETMKSGMRPRLGATVHFNTTIEYERDRFEKLNTLQRKLSPNVLLNNKVDQGSPSLGMLQRLSSDSSFVLYRKVNWGQRMHKEHLLSALALLKATANLHSTFGPCLRETGHEAVVRGMDKVVTKLGQGVARSNVMLFWQVIDECWGVRNIVVKQGAPQIRLTFLVALALLMSNHINFWADSRLVVNQDMRKKLRKFPVHDPRIAGLCSAGGITGGARKVLYQMLLDHVNSGKRTGRLTPRKKTGSLVPVRITDVEKEAAHAIA